MDALALVEFIETEVFAKRLPKVLDDDSYAEFQFFLANNPEAGDVIPEGGGLRKVRWAAPGRGKRFGVRILYFWVLDRRRVYLVMAFAKNQKDDLSRRELAALRAAAKGLR